MNPYQPPSDDESQLDRIERRFELHHGDCLDVLKTLADCSVDAIVTDPPYGLSFMGKRWDYDVPTEAVWVECLRVLKPGGHLLAFAGTRTQHRMAVRIEDAGFEIRDMIAWVYGSGFPKSLDVSKAIDKGSGENRDRQLKFTAWMRSTGITADQINEATQSSMASHYLTDKSQPAIATADLFDKLRPFLPDVPEEIERLVCERTGIEWTAYKQREVVGKGSSAISTRKDLRVDNGTVWGAKSSEFNLTAPATEAAKQWEGWGTALKPAVEPVGVYHKGLTLENVFGILMASLTQELWRSICQWSNASASDAENLLSGIRARLEKAEAFSVVESARTFALENIESAILAASSSISPKLTETARDTTKGGSAQEGVNPSGRKLDMQGTETQAGRVDVMSMVDMFICATTEHTGQNIASLWSGILGETLNQANTFTIATALRLTTALKTLKCLVQASTLQSTGSLESCSPALEPITLARKPLIGTVAANVLEHGTGGLNIDGCRVEGKPPSVPQPSLGVRERITYGFGTGEGRNGEMSEASGRFPANFIHDGSEEVLALFPDSDGSGSARTLNRGQRDDGWGMADEPGLLRDAGSGSAARFFYCAKASRDDRDEGLDGFELHEPDHGRGNTAGGLQVSNSKNPRRNTHSTVKPTDLMRYLCRLITPPNGIVLDPFTGSGSTGKAAMAEGFRFIGIEREAEYIEIARARISAEAEKPRQLSLF
jgi:DNA modification methylase